MRNSSLPSPIHNQRGISLVMGLMFLVMLTIVGLAAMRGTILEERMAGNARDRDLAFQAAEAALKVAEDFVLDNPATPYALGTAYTLVIPNGRGLDADYWQNVHNWAQQSTQLMVPQEWQPGNTAAAPSYVVERLNTRLPNGKTSYVYRITAQGVGRDADTVVLLQTHVLSPE